MGGERERETRKEKTRRDRGTEKRERDSQEGQMNEEM